MVEVMGIVTNLIWTGDDFGESITSLRLALGDGLNYGRVI
jgi:hypothetical protein